MDIKKQIGQNIKKIRTEKNLKQSAFADEINKQLKIYNIDGNYDSKSISNWENGIAIPKLEVLIILAKCFNISLDDLLKDKIETITLTNNCFNNNNCLEEIVKNPNICKMINGKRVSSWNQNRYNYGILSYLAENLTNYRGNFGKIYKVENEIKKSCIITSILTMENGKIEYHGLGNGKNDIVDVIKTPIDIGNYFMDDELNAYLNYYNIFNYDGFIIRLGNGKYYKTYFEGDNTIDLPFAQDSIPPDLHDYISFEDADWKDYCDIKGVLESTEYYDCVAGGGFYDKKANIYISTWDYELNITDNQLIQVLLDDYEIGLHKCLELMSDNEMEQKLEN